MKTITCILTLTAIVLGIVQCQIHYVPANVYVPINTNHIGWNNSYISFNNGSRNDSWNGPGHIFWGKIGSLDRLLFNKLYFKDSHWWTWREKIIEYPKDVESGYVRHETISAIHIINKFYQGNHANATILNGGVGRQYVKIKLGSKWGYGFKFLLYSKGSHWWTSMGKIIRYPKDAEFGYVRNETISAIHINKFYQGNHTKATILNGGVGRQYVKIQLVSRFGHEFKFLVQIYGH